MYTPLPDGFWPVLKMLQQKNCTAVFREASPGNVQSVLEKNKLDPEDLLLLLSPAAENCLEAIAKKAHELTLRNFGRSIQLFTPLYLANYCTNRCVYCGFSTRRDIERRKMTLNEVDEAARKIAATGLRKILALTGDAPKITGAEYLADCIQVLAKYFSSVGIEVPSMTMEEYALVVAAGADSMTMFQETYDQNQYAILHPSGPKSNFHFRLDAPERAILGGIRAVNLGPLLGLADWRLDSFAAAMHAAWIAEKYPEIEISISLPRMRPHTEGGENAFQPQDVTDRKFVQILIALRCFLPQCGITMSSREQAAFRDKLLPLGVTRVSAGVSTVVGGDREKESTTGEKTQADKPQFEISDERSVDEMCAALLQAGFQPVFSDWLLSGAGNAALTPSIKVAVANTAE